MVTSSWHLASLMWVVDLVTHSRERGLCWHGNMTGHITWFTSRKKNIYLRGMLSSSLIVPACVCISVCYCEHSVEK